MACTLFFAAMRLGLNLAGTRRRRLLGVRKSAASAKITGRRIMTPEEGERLFKPGKDGTIFVLDLSHIDGQHAAEALECEHEQVEIRLQQRTNNLQYLLVLQPKVGQTMPMLVEPAALPEAADRDHCSL